MRSILATPNLIRPSSRRTSRPRSASGLAEVDSAGESTHPRARHGPPSRKTGWLRGNPVSPPDEGRRVRGCPRNCQRRAFVPHKPLEVSSGKAGGMALTREPGDLPRRIELSSGGVSRWIVCLSRRGFPFSEVLARPFAYVRLPLPPSCRSPRMSSFPVSAAVLSTPPFRPARAAVLRAGCAMPSERPRRNPLAML